MRKKRHKNFTEYLLRSFFSLKTLRSFIILIVIYSFLVLTMILIQELNTEDVTQLSNSFKTKHDIEYKVKVKENIYRDKIYKKIYNLYSDTSIQIINSIYNTDQERNLIKKTIIINELKSINNISRETISIDRSNLGLLTQLEYIKVVFDVDYERLDNILKLSKSDNIYDNLKFGYYIKTKYEIKKKINIETVIIIIFISLFLLIIAYYINKIGIKNKNHTLQERVKSIQEDIKHLEKVKTILRNENITKDEIIDLKKLVNNIQENLYSYDYGNILESMLYQDLVKVEKKSNELYSRSTLMLILGLLVAVLGILIFYFTIPDYHNIDSTQYLTSTIRPTLILLFIQSISFYLLKQYRSLITDYKYFYNEYLKKSKLLIAYQLMQNKNNSTEEIKLIDNLLYRENLPEINDKDAEIPNDTLLEALKVIVNKLK